MSKAKVEESVGELLRWLPDYTHQQGAAMMKAIGAFLGSLPGGDAWEDMGYENYEFSWQEVSLVSAVINSVDGRMDNEHVTELLFAFNDEDDDEDDDE